MNKDLVVLVYPKTGFDVLGVSVDLPLSLLYVAAPIQSEFDVRIVDQRTQPDWERQLTQLAYEEPLCVGISSMTGPQIKFGIEVAKIFRQFSPQTKIVWGGWHPSLFPEQVLSSGYADVVIRESGVFPFQILLQELGESSPDFQNVPSCSWLGGKTRLFEYRKDWLDTLPELPYHLIDVSKYIGSQGRFVDVKTRSLIATTGFGCPYSCGYCSMSALESGKVLHRESVNHILDRTKDLCETFDLDAIAFHDEEFLLDATRARRIAHGLIERFGGRAKGFRWWCQTRMDSLDRLGIDGLELLYESGLESFQPGIESGSQRILDLVNKRETVEQFIRVNKMLSCFEFEPLYNFVVGFPTETLVEIRDTLRLAAQLLDNNPHAMVAGMYVFVPYPGTPLFKLSQEYGFKPPLSLDEWADYNRQHALTPWIKDSFSIESLVEYARITSRFVDGKRLYRRLSQARSDLSFDEILFTQLADSIKSEWRDGPIGNLPKYQMINELCLKLFVEAAGC